jgi:hypothetical protein
LSWLRGVSDQGLNALAEACPNLVSISLHWVSAQDSLLRILAQRCPRLVRLDFRTVSEFTDMGFLAIATGPAALPQLSAPQSISTRSSTDSS